MLFRSRCLRRVLGAGDEGEVVGDVLTPLGEEPPVGQPLGDDDVGHRVDEGDVRARLDGQVVCRLDMRRADQLDPSGVRDDERRSVAQAPLDPRAEDWVGIGGVGADDEDDVGLVDRLEVLGAGRRAERLAEPIPGGGVADPSACLLYTSPSPRD